MGLFDAFAKINAALNNKPPQGMSQTPLNKQAYGGRFDNSALLHNKAKLKQLGMESMPEGGQEELDRQWNEYQAKQGKAAAMLKAGRGK